MKNLYAFIAVFMISAVSFAATTNEAAKTETQITVIGEPAGTEFVKVVKHFEHAGISVAIVAAEPFGFAEATLAEVPELPEVINFQLTLRADSLLTEETYVNTIAREVRPGIWHFKDNRKPDAKPKGKAIRQCRNPRDAI